MPWGVSPIYLTQKVFSRIFVSNKCVRWAFDESLFVQHVQHQFHVEPHLAAFLHFCLVHPASHSRVKAWCRPYCCWSPLCVGWGGVVFTRLTHASLGGASKRSWSQMTWLDGWWTSSRTRSAWATPRWSTLRPCSWTCPSAHKVSVQTPHPSVNWQFRFARVRPCKTAGGPVW